MLRTLPGNRTLLRVSPLTSSPFWRTRVDRVSRADRQTLLILSTWRPIAIREWAKRIHDIFNNGKPAVVNSSCTTTTSESRASTAPGAPLNRSCKRPLRSAALRRSGKQSKILCLERLVGGRIVRAQSLWREKTRSQRFRRTGVFNDRSLSYSPCVIEAGQSYALGACEDLITHLGSSELDMSLPCARLRPRSTGVRPYSRLLRSSWRVFHRACDKP